MPASANAALPFSQNGQRACVLLPLLFVVGIGFSQDWKCALPLKWTSPLPYFHLLCGFGFSSGSVYFSEKRSSWKLLTTMNIVNWGNSSKSNIKATIQSQSGNQVYIAKSSTAIKLLRASPISDFRTKLGICPNQPVCESRPPWLGKEKTTFFRKSELGDSP